MILFKNERSQIEQAYFIVNLCFSYSESVFYEEMTSKRLWPPRSPDLEPRDLYLWGFLKTNFYSCHLQLQLNIQRTVHVIYETFTTVFDNIIHLVHLRKNHKAQHTKQSNLLINVNSLWAVSIFEDSALCKHENLLSCQICH